MRNRYTWIKWTTIYACGHTVVEGDNYLPTDYQEQTRHDTRLCPDCYRAAQRAEEAQLIEQAESQYHLPDLIGTPKQIAWARSIRAFAIQNFEQRRKGAGAKVNQVIDYIERLDQAAYWIDHRQLSVDAIGMILIAARGGLHIFGMRDPRVAVWDSDTKSIIVKK